MVLGANFAFLIDENDRKTLEESDFSSVVAVTSSEIDMLHFVARLQPATGRFRPFLDALIGFKYFETSTSINEHAKSCDPDFFDCTRSIDHEKHNSDIALSYGAGAGVDVEIYDSDTYSVRAVVAVRYLFGEKAKYVIPSARIIDADTVAFETTRSRTDLLTTQLGLSIQF